MADRREQLLDDKHWREVEYINSYAVFMGYLSMAIKGMAFLVLTWTTVVLLGGFVSDLSRKDFWCLTFITLVQTAGIFDVNLNEKLGYMKNAADGLLAGVVSGVMGDTDTYGYTFFARFVFACVLVLVQLVVLFAVLCPLAIMYVLGIMMSGGISLWRLIEHDYGGNFDGKASNLASAMDTLYCLALIQGVLFCYRFILARAGKRLANEVADKNSDLELQVVSTYLRETKRGCEKDPLFAKGRNLITNAVDKIGSSSPTDCISGVKMLYTAVSIVERQLMQPGGKDIFLGQSMLMKHLVMSMSSSRHVMQKLLETLDSRGLHDTETRLQAAKVVERLAFNINLEEFPRGIQHISSLIGILPEYSIAEPYERENDLWFLAPSLAGGYVATGSRMRDKLGEAYTELLLQGLCILHHLAADENNCRVMSDTRDLVSKIIAPVTADLLDHTSDDHGVWSEVVDVSMEVMVQLIGAPGETGAKLRQEISGCKEAIGTMQRIIRCNDCYERMRKNAIWILTRLCMDTTKKLSSIREDFVKMLVNIFMTDNTYSSSMRGSAGDALSEICFHGGISDATIVIQTGGGHVVDGLTKVLLYDKNKKCRQVAVEILEHLCTHYTEEDEYLGKLKKAMTDVMPMVLGEIFNFEDEETDIEDYKSVGSPETDSEDFKSCGSSETGNKDIEWQGDNDFHPKNDVKRALRKMLCCGVKTQFWRVKTYKREDIALGNGIKSSPRAAMHSVLSTTLLSSLLSLCWTVYDTMFISDLPWLDASRFLNKLKEILLDERRDPTMENLSLYKVIGKIVISTMENRGFSRFVQMEDPESFIDTFARASKNMMDLDHSMVFHSSASSFESRSKLDRCTLKSLVEEAKRMAVHGVISCASDYV